MRKFSLIIIAAVLAMLMLTGCVPEEAPPAADPTAQQALNIANTNTGSIQALAARVGTVEGRTAGEVTQAELDALAGQVATLRSQVAELQEQIDELNSTGTGNPSDPTVVATETRWRPRLTFDYDVLPPDVTMYLKEIDPRTIKEAGIYTIVLALENAAAEVTIEGLICNILLQPNESVFVSDDTDVYQVAGPYNIYWNIDVRTSSANGLCRFIEMETDPVNVKIPAGTVSTPKTLLIEIEFELVYGQ